MRFKYSITCSGDRKNKKRLAEELTKLGYKRDGISDEFKFNYLSINESKRPQDSNIKQGEFGCYQNKYDRDYSFNIDNEWEFQAALAIAAIRDDNEGYIGEIWWYDEYAYQIIENDRTIIGVWWNSYTRHVYGKIAVGIGNWKKATPEEIIEHFKNNKLINMNKKKMNEKKIIGYKLIRPEYREAVKIIGDFTNIETFENYELTAFAKDYKIVKNKLIDAKVLDLWFKPVYEQDEVTIGGYKAIKEGDLVAFGCQKFDIAELYAYKKLLQGHKENKAEITVMGTKISVEILDRLIEML